MRWSGALLRLCGHVMTRDDVIPTSCVLAAVAVCLQLVAACSFYLLVAGPAPLPLQLTGMTAAVDTLRSEAGRCDRQGVVDVGALDAWYRRHVTFEIANLAGALRFFADGKWWRRGAAVTSLGVSTKLLYDGRG